MDRPLQDTPDSAMLPALLSPDLAPLFWRPSRLGYDSAWTAHLPFAHWIVGATRPRVLVELGTHNGVSYAGFCEAVVQCKLETRCYAVDTWEGDEHAGHYDESVYNDLRRFHEQRYSAFSELLRRTFDQALDYFAPGSIDLLHIDGCHGYDAVRHDFESWLPKLSQQGVVLFHDTNVRERGFGVWQLLEELRARYPVFEFLHEYGLGVVAVGPQPPAAVADLCALRDPDRIALLRDRFSQLGERWRAEVHIRMLAEQVEDARRMLRAESQAMQQRVLEASRVSAQAAQRTVEARRAAASAMFDVDRLTTDLEAARAETATRLSEAATRLSQAEQAYAAELHRLGGEAARGRDAMQEAARLRLDLPELAAARDVLTREIQRIRHQAEWAILERNLWSEQRYELGVAHAELENSHGRLLHDRNRLQGERDALAGQVRYLSLRLDAWRGAPRPPVRKPGRLKTALGLGARLVFWTLTLRLRASLRRRAQLRQDLATLADCNLFDAGWYRETYPDVTLTGQDPALHYIQHGARERRHPGPLFDAGKYLDDYPDIARAGLNPLLHYLRYGAAEGRSIAPVAGLPVLPAVPPPPEALPLPGRWTLREPELDPKLEPKPYDGLSAFKPDARRIVWFEGEPGTPGSEYRVARAKAAAEQAGAVALSFPVAEAGQRETEIMAADAVVIWRAPWSTEVVAIVDATRKARATLVFDVDDLMVEPDLARTDLIDGIRTQFIPEAAVRSHYSRMRDTMANSEFCIVSTEELAWYTRRHAKPTFVLPNGFDAASWRTSRRALRQRRQTPGDGLFRIGYAAGSRTHQRDFAVAAGAVARILREFPHTRLVLFSSRTDGMPLVDISEFPELKDLDAQIEWRELVPLAELPQEMARFDVNLAPLETGNPFCEAKSELKYFEGALTGVLTIASPTGPFRRAISHGVTGLLAATQADWYEAIRGVIADPERAARMVRAAYRDVLWKFGPERRAEAMAAMLDQIMGGPAAARAFALETARAALPHRDMIVPRTEVMFEADTLADASVTVIVPLYNYAHHVIEALDSVKDQTLTDLHLVIVDDCSTDESLSVALDWAREHAARFGRILVLRNAVNMGLGPTRNAGFDAAETPYVLPLDADNRLRLLCAEKLLEEAEESGAAFVYPVIQEFGESGKLMGALPYAPQRLAGTPYIDAMALVSVAAWAAVGGYWDGRLGWEDYEFWCRLAEYGLNGSQVHGKPLADYRVHRGSMLQAITENKSNKPQVMEDITRRHPWLRIIYARDFATPPPVKLGEIGTLEALLPLLRCPVTGQDLRLDAVAGVLVNADGTQRWPVIDGRPLLYPGLTVAPVLAAPAQGEPLPAKALEIMRAAGGPVLNLGGHGTPSGLPHVIEAGPAIFPNTRLVADMEHLPFADASLAAVVALGGLEHCRNPAAAAAELFRVLRPGGQVLVHTAFLQPEHDAPRHFFNATREGVAAWFAGFETEALQVSANLGPAYAVAWLAHAAQAALQREDSEAAAAAFAATPLGQFAALWTNPAGRAGDAGWQALQALPQPAQAAIAAGFEFVGRRPPG